MPNCQSKGWRCTRYQKGSALWVQVLPTNDTREHQEDGVNCWCRPKVDKQRTASGLGFIVSHNSGDGRELVEQYGAN